MYEKRLYTTQLQAGLGMIQESLDLLQIWEPGENPSQLAEKVISKGLFARATARRARNIVAEMFAPRLLSGDAQAARWLKFLLSHGFPGESLRQLLFIYTARAQAIFADFLIEVYWRKYGAGASSLNRQDAERFVLHALDSGRMAARWSESTVKRVSGYLVGCCGDFGLLTQSRGSARAIQRFSMRTDVSLYLAHELHFFGLADAAVVQHRDWLLFGFEPGEVLARLKSIAQDGHFVVQSSGELIQISWKYKNMEDCLHALTQR